MDRVVEAPDILVNVVLKNIQRDPVQIKWSDQIFLRLLLHH